MRTLLTTLLAAVLVLTVACKKEKKPTPASGSSSKASDSRSPAQRPSTPPPARRQAEGPTCEAFAKHVVHLLKPQGKDAFFKEKDIPNLAKACQKAKPSDADKKGMACMLKSKDIKAAKKCKPGLNKIIKPWMKLM